jgi:hypothetical protein
MSQSKYDIGLGVIGLDDQTLYFATIFGKARKYKTSSLSDNSSNT